MFSSKMYVNARLEGLKQWVRDNVRGWVGEYVGLELKQREDWNTRIDKAATAVVAADMKAAHEALDKSADKAVAMGHAGCGCGDRDCTRYLKAAGPVTMGIDMAAPSPPKWECGCWGCHSYRNPVDRNLVDDFISYALWGGRKQSDDGRTPHCDSKKLAKVETQLKALLTHMDLYAADLPAVPGKTVVQPIVVDADIPPIKRTRTKPKKRASTGR